MFSFQGIKSLIEDFVKRQQPLLFFNLKPSVIATFQGVEPKELVYCQTYSELYDLLKKYASRGSNGSINC